MKIKLLFLALLFISNSFAQDLNITSLGNLDYGDVGLNDIWGYSDGEKEYALVGTYEGISVVDVSDPSNLHELNNLKTVNSIWKDIKTHSHYAYVTHGIYSSSTEPKGLTIIDLNTIESENPSMWNYKIDGVFETAHNIFIDDDAFAYVFGVNEIGGALILDLNNDPTNPEFVSYYQSHYLHDGYVKDGKLYGCADKNGYFVVVDVNDKENPKDITSSDTPNRTTHNAWLSDDGNTLFTTDERKSAYITSFDVSDEDNIKQLDIIRTKNTEQSIPHNTLVFGDFLISSYYAQGIQIVDASKPDNLVEVARYDTTPSNKAEFNGAWGVYPYLPSGNILVSDTETGLHVLKATYSRAAYFEGVIKDEATNSSIYNAEVIIKSEGISDYSTYTGGFKSGASISGTYEIEVIKEGYESKVFSVDLVQGQTKNVEVFLKQGQLGVEDELLSEFKAYPNPFKNLLTIEYSFKDLLSSRSELLLYNSSGQELYRLDLDANSDTVIIDKELDAGVYLIQIFNGTKQSKVIRVVKEN